MSSTHHDKHDQFFAKWFTGLGVQGFRGYGVKIEKIVRFGKNAVFDSNILFIYNNRIGGQIVR